jgi:uncharacterized protein (DUF305 family)
MTDRLHPRILAIAASIAACLLVAPSISYGQEATPGAMPPLRPVSEICAGGDMAMTADTGPVATPEAADFDLAFIDLMVVHHEGAIDMATIALERAEHQEIKDLAQQIISSQSAEIAQMQAWRDEWYPGTAELTETQAMAIFDQAAASSPGMAGVPGSSEMMMGMDDMSALCNAAPGEFDLAFIDGMVPHHTGAILMAQAALQYSTHQAIKDLAAQIISAQQAEIDGMNAWRALWSPATPAADDQGMGDMKMGAESTPSQ